MLNLKSCTALGAIVASLAAAGNAQADTTIGTAATAPVLTATAASGQPDNVIVSTAGTVTLTSGTALTQNSANTVANAGTLKISGANNATGILATVAGSGAIVNSGTITLDEDYTATDTDSDGDIDGPFAQGSARNGIWISTGAPHLGDVTNSGTITIEGNRSAGIRLDAPLTGNLTSSGTITVLGDNSYGVVTQGVSGDVALSGTISATGANSTGAAILGDVGGGVRIQGAITSTGYRSTTAPTDVSKLDADDLLQGGPALKISGNVANGIIFDVPPTTSTTNTDVDGDGILDANEGSASVISYGAAAAVEIGATDRATMVGAVPNTPLGSTTGYGIVAKGTIAGNGVYAGVDSTGMRIGGLGGAVIVTKGMSVAASLTASSLDSNATALRIGSGASVPILDISGTIGATGASLDGKYAIGIAIDGSAQVSTLTNSGTIYAAARGTAGNATAILDSAGTLSSVTNTGKITATVAATGKTIALDLRNNSGGITLTQAAASATAAAPGIIGDIYTGSGNDVLTASAGTIMGDAYLGAGNDSVALSGGTAWTGAINFGAGTSALSLAGTSSLTGNADFGGGAGTMTLADTSRFTGQLLNSGNVALTVAGTLALTNSGTVNLASLNAGAASVLTVNIDAANASNTLYAVSGAASFTSGSQVKVALSKVDGSQGSFVFVRAGSLTGTPALAVSSTLLPYMFSGTISTDATRGEATLTIAKKTAAQMGLNASSSSAYEAVFKALDNEGAVAQSFLNITDGDSFRTSLQQMLPDHAGGTFEAVTSGSRATARILADPRPIVQVGGGMGIWLQQMAFGGAKSIGNTASYDVNGWGTAGGVEFHTPVGYLGGSLAYMHGTDGQSGNDNAVDDDQFELGGYWRAQWGKLQGWARGSIAQIGFKSQRRFAGTTSAGTSVVRLAQGKWDGRLLSGAAGLSYEVKYGAVTLRPVASIDYYRLKEDGYSETGGGDAFNLTVLDRTSDESAVNGSVAFGYQLAGRDHPEDGWTRVELEGGRRQLIGGTLGDTTASFKNGQAFTLTPEQRTSGWTGKARVIGGSDGFSFAGEFSAEQQQSHVALAVRASLSIPM